MIKVITYLGSFLIPILCSAQELPHEDGAVTYTKVIDLDTVKAAEIYTRAQAWATASVPSKDAIVSDVPNRFLSYRVYVAEIMMMVTVKIFIKDGRAKAQVSDLYLTPQKQSIEDLEKYFAKRRKVIKPDFVAGVNAYCEGILASIEEGLKKSDFDF